MTRVCHIIKATRLSGAERHLTILLPALRARQIDARLLLLTEPAKPMDNIMALADYEGIPTKRLTIRRGLDLAVIGRMRTVLREMQPDIVHTHLIHADVLGLLAAQGAGVRTIVTTRHNDDAFRNRLPMQLVNYWNWRSVAAGVVISSALEQFVQQVEHAPARKINLIPYGMVNPQPDSAAFVQARRALRAELGLAEDAVLVGMVSRLIEQKGIIYALEAFARVCAEYPAAQLVIAGDGELRAALEARSNVLGLAGRVHFLGWREDAPAVLRALDIFLMPSLWEGFGLTLLEAMSARLPVIASHVSAIPEVVVHGETGYLVARRDPDAIAYALRLLLADRLLRQHLGLNGEDRLESAFSVARMADQTTSLYRTLLDNPR